MMSSSTYTPQASLKAHRANNMKLYYNIKTYGRPQYNNTVNVSQITVSKRSLELLWTSKSSI